MFRVLCFVISFFSIACSFAQSPILTIKPGGHTALIKAMVATSDGNYVLAAGDDKSVKVWSVESGEVVSEFWEKQALVRQVLLVVLPCRQIINIWQ